MSATRGVAWRLVALLVGIAVAGWGVDLLVKEWVLATLPEGRQVQVLGEVLQWHFVRNPGAAFSLASSTLFPALVLGVFWKRANQQGAIAGMLIGFAVCVFYMIRTYPTLGGSSLNQWFSIAPISAGVFGVPAGFLAIMLVSLFTTAPDRGTDAFVDHIRTP